MFKLWYYKKRFSFFFQYFQIVYNAYYFIIKRAFFFLKEKVNSILVAKWKPWSIIVVTLLVTDVLPSLTYTHKHTNFL